MNIFYLIQYFPPELNGGATRAADLARLWSEMGHQVTIITAFPNHPHGKVLEAYRKKLFLTESNDGYKIRRCFIYATPNKGFFRRILNHLSFSFSLVLGNLSGQRPDIIIISSPPLLLGLGGFVLSKLWKSPYIFEVRDIWPQQAVDLGMLRNSIAIKFFERVEFFLYNHAVKVIGVAESTAKLLTERGLDSRKINIVFNGTDIDTFKPGSADDELINSLGLGGRFIVSYIGTIGLSQGVTNILDAARLLQNAYPQIHFLIVGDGAEKEAIVKRKLEMKLSNVTILGTQPRQKVVDLYHLSDIVLVLLRRLPLFRSTIPSKMFEIMACGKPLLLAVEGEAEEVVLNAQAGLTIPPEDTTALADAILRLYNDKDLRLRLGMNGRHYVVKYHDRRSLARQYISILESVV